MLPDLELHLTMKKSLCELDNRGESIPKQVIICNGAYHVADSLKSRQKYADSLHKARRSKGFELAVLKKSRENLVDFCHIHASYVSHIVFNS